MGVITLKVIPEWFFEEKQIGIDYLNKDIALKYEDEHQNSEISRKNLWKLFDKLNITKDDLVLDFGCGTGAIALNIAKIL